VKAVAGVRSIVDHVGRSETPVGPRAMKGFGAAGARRTTNANPARRDENSTRSLATFNYGIIPLTT
jgi:hypothetical protein